MLPVIRNSKLCDNYSNGVIKGLETPARRDWFRLGMGKIQESLLEELELEGPVEMQSMREQNCVSEDLESRHAES